ncbi:MAG: hypothetical protein AAGF20_11925, partial [Pseudomonadota bacterium]
MQTDSDSLFRASEAILQIRSKLTPGPSGRDKAQSRYRVELTAIVADALDIMKGKVDWDHEYVGDLQRTKSLATTQFIGVTERDLLIAAAACKSCGRMLKRMEQEDRSDEGREADAFIEVSRIAELRNLESDSWDFRRLTQMCLELNTAYRAGSFISCTMLLRAIIDHVPPVFGVERFSMISSRYNGSQSFKKGMEILSNAMRKIGDSHLHTQIRQSESLPNKTQ